VDALIKNVLNANSEAELQTAAHALDRVLMHGYYIIPWRYLTHSYMIHSKRLQRPRILPDYYDPYGWAQATWWDGDAARVSSR
jgi:microcin C transport system substrate-binding protein